MASLGKAFIEIHADLKEFPAETRAKLKAALEEGAAGMNIKPIEEKVTQAGRKAADGLEKGLTARLREKASAFAKRGTEVGDKIMHGLLGAVTSRAALIGALITTAVLGAGQLVGPIAALAGMIPAAMGTAVASVAVLATAFHGVGGAIKAAFGDDQQALNQAMAKLAPAAREVVAEFASFRPQLHALGQDIQQTFFVQLEGSVKRLMSTLLPTLRTRLHEISGDLGQLMRGALDAMSSPSGKSGIDSMLLAAHHAILPLIPAVKQLVGAFITLGAAGGPAMATLSTRFAGLLTRFSEFIERIDANGQLSAFFDAMLVALQAVSHLVGDLGSIVLSVFKAMQAGGVDIIGVLGIIVHEIALLFAGPQGQQLLIAIGSIIVAVGQILIAITPVLPSLALLIAHVGTDLADALIASLPLIDKLVSWLTALITFLDDHRSAVEGFAVALGVMYGVFKTAKAIDDAVTGLKKFKDAVQALSVVQEVATWMRGLTTAQAAATVASDTLTASLVAQDAAWFANPIGLIILAIVAIIAGIVLLIVYWDDVKKAGAAAWHWIENAAKSVWNWLKGVGSSIGDWFGSVLHWFEELPGKIGSFLAGLPSMLGNLLLGALYFAGQMVGIGIGILVWSIVRLPGLIWDGLKSLGSLLGGLFTDAWHWATHAVSVGIDATLDFFTKLPGRIWNFLTALPGVIADAFRSAWRWAKDETAKAGDWILDFARKLPGRLGNFFGNVGHDIVAGLRSGINAAIKGFNTGIDKAAAWLPGGVHLPHIPLLAKGAIIDSPTLAVVGERGPEAVIPLNDPARAQQLAAQSGLTRILGQGAAAPIVNVTAYLGTGQILDIMRLVVETIIGGQATQLHNGVRTA